MTQNEKTTTDLKREIDRLKEELRQRQREERVKRGKKLDRHLYADNKPIFKTDKNKLLAINPKTNQIIDTVKIKKSEKTKYIHNFKTKGNFSPDVERVPLIHVSEYNLKVEANNLNDINSKFNKNKESIKSTYQYYMKVRYDHQNVHLEVEARSLMTLSKSDIYIARDNAYNRVMSKLSDLLGYGYDTKDLDKFVKHTSIIEEKIIWYK